MGTETTALVELLKRVPWYVLLTAGTVIFLFGRAKVVQFFLQRHDKKVEREEQEQQDERKQLTADRQDLVTALERQLAQEHAWRLDETSYYLNQIRGLRDDLAARDALIAVRDDTITRLARTLESVETGNSRLRHALNNVLVYVGVMRGQMVRGGLEPPRYDGLQNMLGIDKALDESLRKVFEEAGIQLPVPPEQHEQPDNERKDD